METEQNPAIDLETDDLDQMREQIIAAQNQNKEEQGEVTQTQEVQVEEKHVTESTKTEDTKKEEPAKEAANPQLEVKTKYGETLKGKTPDELIKIAEDSQQWASRWANEVNSYKKRLEELEVKAKEPDQKSEFEHLTEGYDQEQIKIVRALIAEEHKNIEQSRHAATKKELDAIEAQNNDDWLMINNNPEIRDLFLAKAKEKSAQAGKTEEEIMHNTLQKKNWVKETLIELMSEKVKDTSSNNKTDLSEKKRLAGSAGASVTPKKVVKTVQEMSPEEYAEFANLRRI